MTILLLHKTFIFHPHSHSKKEPQSFHISSMAQQNSESHVPKFGDWDNDNIPYTAYFDNARKGKAGKMMNPNDPEENPEAFTNHFSPATKTSAGKQYSTDHDDASIYSNHGRSGRSHKSSTPEYSRETGNSDHSLLQKSGHRRSNNVKKRSAMAEELSPTTYGVHPSPHRTPSVPKFGAWDDADPKSGEGFTAIFNKMKTEKQFASNSNYTTINPSANNYSNALVNRQRSPFISKICGCMRPDPRD